MTDRLSLAQRIIRDRMDAGESVSVESLRLWGGFGTGNPCDPAANPSTRRRWSTSNRLHDGTTAYRFNIGCADSWRAELNRREVP
jgi:hypothetical protein